MRTTTVAANWKMNLTVSQARELVKRVRAGLKAVDNVKTVLFPPHTALAAVSEALHGSRIGVGAQNIHFEDQGAFTGEVSPGMVAELAQYVIVGHSERRHLFAEMDETVGHKVEAAIKAGLTPILCVGETSEEREQGRAHAVVERQVAGGLDRVKSLEGLMLAYEPVWAIGTGAAATPADAQDVMSRIRTLLRSRFGEEVAASTPVLYGGSVNDENVSAFLGEQDVDGALVGGASLKAEVFVRLVLNAARAA